MVWSPSHSPLVKRIKKNGMKSLSNYLYQFLSLRNQKTRWGSCSAKNNISLNMNLIRLPQKQQDYVILHELVHTKHKNHSRDFWAEMDRIVGDGKRLRREMRGCRLGV
jgi:predicted metal-dependent hydrolase